MKQRMAGKVALVVGAGSVAQGWGNGKAAAVLYARHGAQVFAVDQAADAVRETRALIEAEGGRCVDHVAEATRSQDVRAMVERCIAEFGRVDVLHNNVGGGPLGGPVEASEESWDRAFELNVKTAFLASKHALPHMVAQGGGAIVNISSIAAVRWSGVSYVSYYASKAALNQFTQSVALEYAGRNVRCNAIMPGLMDTPQVYRYLAGQYGDDGASALREARRRQVPLGTGDAWDVANAALFLASDEARYITGSVLTVDGGMTCSMVVPGGVAP